MRVVLDTNVLFAAIAARGLCEALVAACLRTQTVVLSEYILAELDEHLASKARLPDPTRRQYLALLRHHTELIEPADLPASVCPDPDDLPVLGTAIAGRADALVTGDKDLLNLRQIHGIPVLSPREFYERLR